LRQKNLSPYSQAHKVRCPNDGKIRVEQFDELRGRFTRRFTEAGWFLGPDDEVVYRIILEELAREKLSPVPPTLKHERGRAQEGQNSKEQPPCRPSPLPEKVHPDALSHQNDNETSWSS
jgi:hypothetical protein